MSSSLSLKVIDRNFIFGFIAQHLIKGAKETQLSNLVINSNRRPMVRKTGITVCLESHLHAGRQPGLELFKVWNSVFTGSPAQLPQ